MGQHGSLGQDSNSDSFPLKLKQIENKMHVAKGSSCVGGGRVENVPRTERKTVEDFSNFYLIYQALGVSIFLHEVWQMGSIYDITWYSFLQKNGFSNVVHATSDSKNFKPEYFNALIAWGIKAC